MKLERARPLLRPDSGTPPWPAPGKIIHGQETDCGCPQDRDGYHHTALVAAALPWRLRWGWPRSGRSRPRAAARVRRRASSCRRRVGRPAAQAPAPSPAASAVAASGVDAELIGSRYLGMKPFAPAPPPPAVKPITLSASDPTVFSRVPLTDKVVFVTIDDGIEKDPKLIQMVKDFQVPITISLADVLIRDDYAYFEKLYETGYVSIQNHTVDHPLDMPALSASQQLYEIAAQQEKLRREYGGDAVHFPAAGRQLQRDDDRLGQPGGPPGPDAMERGHADH